jgi:hypothetical protein
MRFVDSVSLLVRFKIFSPHLPHYSSTTATKSSDVVNLFFCCGSPLRVVVACRCASLLAAVRRCSPLRVVVRRCASLLASARCCSALCVAGRGCSPQSVAASCCSSLLVVVGLDLYGRCAASKNRRHSFSSGSRRASLGSRRNILSALLVHCARCAFVGWLCTWCWRAAARNAAAGPPAVMLGSQPLPVRSVCASSITAGGPLPTDDDDGVVEAMGRHFFLFCFLVVTIENQTTSLHSVVIDFFTLSFLETASTHFSTHTFTICFCETI